ncbi:MAG: RHS repeat-associated core domain-containing protein [Oscillospiraceae bacterium]|nr:RHS repeat-associated core domain-containing protein [Oscillospiraceae bacterium]
MKSGTGGGTGSGSGPQYSSGGVNIGEINPIRYRGYYYDNETGYYFCQTRYYNPEWQRWLNADSLFIAGNPLTASNMYAYCGGDPVNYTDSTGRYDSKIHYDATYGWAQKVFAENGMEDQADTYADILAKANHEVDTKWKTSPLNILSPHNTVIWSYHMHPMGEIDNDYSPSQLLAAEKITIAVVKLFIKWYNRNALGT